MSHVIITFCVLLGLKIWAEFLTVESCVNRGNKNKLKEPHFLLIFPLKLPNMLIF
jgi:hypothetical protein